MAEALTRDPVDALHDAQQLTRWLGLRTAAIFRMHGIEPDVVCAGCNSPTDNALDED